MHRVRRDVDVVTDNVNRNDNEIVDVFHIFANATLSNILRNSAANDNVTRCTTSNLIGYMTGKTKLAIVPSNFYLRMLLAVFLKI